MLFSASAFSLDAYHPSFAVHPSGERLILTKLSAQGAEANLILVQNWFEEIEGRFKGER
jgi:hypothetical protein